MTLSPLEEKFLELREWANAPCKVEQKFSTRDEILPGIAVYSEWKHYERPQWVNSLRVGTVDCFVLISQSDLAPGSYRVLVYKMPDEPLEAMNDDDHVLFNQLHRGKISEHLSEIVVKPYAIGRLSSEFFRVFSKEIPAINVPTASEQ
ncbi:hypothetical protein HY492_03920 [Candidatus Woesearchaeota archaeon]|nr:hypothetical protein [Candidatus Woesearchaeota archaeon]